MVWAGTAPTAPDDLQGHGQVADSLRELCCNVVGPMACGADVAEHLRTTDVDVIVLFIDNTLTHTSADAAAQTTLECLARLLAVRRLPIIVLGAAVTNEMAGQLAAAGAYAYVGLPISMAAATVSAQVEIAVQRFEELQRAQADARLAKEALETRKLVDRAKAIYMRRLNIEENAAHRRLQQESQDRRIALADLARDVIAAEVAEANGQQPGPGG